MYNSKHLYLASVGGWRKIQNKKLFLLFWAPERSHSMKSFLPPFYPWPRAHEKRYQALCVLILCASENGAVLGTGTDWHQSTLVSVIGLASVVQTCSRYAGMPSNWISPTLSHLFQMAMKEVFFYMISQFSSNLLKQPMTPLFNIHSKQLSHIPEVSICRGEEYPLLIRLGVSPYHLLKCSSHQPTPSCHQHLHLIITPTLWWREVQVLRCHCWRC